MSDLDLGFRQAQDAVNSILSVLNINHVVNVDDANENEPRIEDVIAGTLGLDGDAQLELFPEIGDSLPDDQDILSSRIRGIWKQLSPEIQQDRGKAVLAASNNNDDTTYL